MVTLAAITFFLKRMLFFVFDNWRVCAITLAAFVTVVFVYRACHKPAKIDQVAIDKINSADRKERLDELKKVIEDNSLVVKTVDNRTAIADTNVVERNRLIDEKIKEADRKITEAQASGQNVTQEQLECLLTGNCQ